MNHIHDDSEGSQAELLKGGTKPNNYIQNSSGGERIGLTDEQRAKRKKIIKWSLIGAIILIIVTLAIVLPLVLKGKEDDTTPTGYNPYHADTKDVVNE